MIHVSEADPGEEREDKPMVSRHVAIKTKEPTEEYTLLEELGRGKFGIVYKSLCKKSGVQCAAKFVNITNKQDKIDVEREVDIMSSLQHPLLLQLFDAFDTKSSMVLILELIEGGELFERVICDDFILTERSCCIFMRQICRGVQYIHQQRILHLDLKPENILCVTRTGNRIKIIDFGLARRFSPGEKLQILFGTPEFVAPEIVNYEQCGFGTDLWAVGVICYILLSGLSPFMGDSDLETMANVTSAEYDFDDEAFDAISDEAKDFIEKLLVRNKDERMTATHCLNHPWLKKGKRKSMAVLDKSKLKKFVIRRRWQKAVNAILALKRMGASLSL